MNLALCCIFSEICVKPTSVLNTAKVKTNGDFKLVFSDVIEDKPTGKSEKHTQKIGQIQISGQSTTSFVDTTIQAKLFNEQLFTNVEANGDFKLTLNDCTEDKGENLKELSERIENLTQKIGRMQSSINDEMVNHETFEKKVVDSVVEHNKRMDKANGFVIIGVPEIFTGLNGMLYDIKFVEKLVEAAGFNKNCIRSVQRFGSHESQSRILQVKLASKNQSNQVLHCPKVKSLLPIGSSIRKDLTLKELKLQKQLWQECHKRNAELNMKKFVVRDLKIVELKHPKVWCH
ncbi:unnamed protein product [Dracunculus medinensis]|uniref:Costars domain-containing protein n=1 Tax=Dracunculus medinensis TaxID=318479 RepID=A0A0N4UBI8_DRAME|nr:unnamed protein product [Dracunculus medinensis]